MFCGLHKDERGTLMQLGVMWQRKHGPWTEDGDVKYFEKEFLDLPVVNSEVRPGSRRPSQRAVGSLANSHSQVRGEAEVKHFEGFTSARVACAPPGRMSRQRYQEPSMVHAMPR